MRIIYTSNNPKESTIFSNFLKSKGIENQLEIDTGKDWGSHDYGNTVCRIWVINEDYLEDSLKWTEEFKKDPSNPLFTVLENPLKGILEPIEQAVKNANSEENLPTETLGPITLYITITCILLFMLATFTDPHFTAVPKNAPHTPFVTAPINKTLMYDYPKAFEQVDEIIKTNGLEKTEDLSKLSIDTFNKVSQTPYWKGVYEKVVLYLQNNKAKINFDAPMFEKLKVGQYWRLFTTALMHGSIFHIFFNLFLFVILGKKMEKKLGSIQFLLFILITAIFSNTAQYLMSGVNFLGISGVITAMIGFILIRQRFAPWEGYQFTSISLGSVLVFIGMMVILQLFSFSYEVLSKEAITPGIANTAHIAGLFIGALIGLANIFKLKN